MSYHILGCIPPLRDMYKFLLVDCRHPRGLPSSSWAVVSLVDCRHPRGLPSSSWTVVSLVDCRQLRGLSSASWTIVSFVDCRQPRGLSSASWTVVSFVDCRQLRGLSSASWTVVSLVDCRHPRGLSSASWTAVSLMDCRYALRSNYDVRPLKFPLMYFEWGIISPAYMSLLLQFRQHSVTKRYIENYLITMLGRSNCLSCILNEV